MPRLFVALPVPDPLGAALAAVRAEADGVRWMRPEQLHLTLAFLGVVEEDRATATAKALRRVEAAPVALEPDRLAVFPNRRRPRALVATLRDEPALLDLHQRVNAALATVGFAPEMRPFRPHLTLARLRDPDRTALGKALRRPLPRLTATITEFRLVESERHPEGSRYATRARYPLGQPSP